MDADALEGERQRRHASPAESAGSRRAERALGGQQQPRQPDRTAQDVVVLEVAHHEAAVRERQRPDRRAEAVRAQRPGVQVEPERRDRVVERTPDAVGERHLQQCEQQRLERREQADLAVREDRVAAKDQRRPERQPPGLQLVRHPERQRIVEGGGIAPEEDRAAASSSEKKTAPLKPTRKRSGKRPSKAARVAESARGRGRRDATRGPPSEATTNAGLRRRGVEREVRQL